MPAEVVADAEGDLAATPFAHLLVHVLDQGLTGALIVREAGVGDHVVECELGAPVRVRPADGADRLGDLLVERDAISRGALEAVVERGHGEPSVRLGARLVAAGLVETRAVERTCDLQLVRRVRRLFALGGASRFWFVASAAPAQPDPCRVHPLAAIWAGLRAHAPLSSKMGLLLDRVGGFPLELREGAPLERLGLDLVEADVVALLRRRPTSLVELLELVRARAAHEDLPPGSTAWRSNRALIDERCAAARNLVYALLILRHCDVDVPGQTNRARTLPCVGAGFDTTRLDEAKARLGVGHASLSASAFASDASGPPSSHSRDRLDSSAELVADLQTTPLGRVKLKTAAVRVGLAAPDEPGSGEPVSRRRGDKSDRSR